MKYKTVILTAAKEDLSEAAKWYNQARSKLGKQFITKVRERLAELRTDPLTCQIRYSEVHTALVEQFPFMIHYYIDQQDKSIIVISILHTSRDPEIWKEQTNK